jgi:hypothetical protein
VQGLSTRGPHAASSCVLCGLYAFFIVLCHPVWWKIVNLTSETMSCKCHQYLAITSAVSSRWA